MAVTNRLVFVISVIALAVHGGKLLSGSDDETVRAWDLATGACERVLLGFDSYVY